MPIYEYRCDSCGHQLEKLQRMNDDMLVECPQCAEPALKRLISAVAFRLKGSGWYETDFKQGEKRNLADSDSAPASETASDSKGSDGTDKAAGKPPADSGSKVSGGKTEGGNQATQNQ